MNIRPEFRNDVVAVRRTICEAFGGTAEAHLVEHLREDNDLLVSLVADIEGQIVGHAGFSRLHIITGDRRRAGVSLAPLCVAPTHQRRGLGSPACRNRASHSSTGRRDDRFFVLGDPAYYGRFGFCTKLAAKFKCEYSGQHFQALAFDPAAAIEGTAVFAPAFNRLG